MLDSEFFHIRMTGSVDNVGVWTRKRWAQLLQQNHFGVHVYLFGLCQQFPPFKELIRELDFPFPRWNIASRLCIVNPTGRDAESPLREDALGLIGDKRGVERDGFPVGVLDLELLRTGREAWRQDGDGTCVFERYGGGLAAQG